jgi:CheY-like chemotaxis protein
VPKILAVDDSATMRRIYEMTFAGQDGMEVVTVDSGDAAIRYVMERGADIVLADASMNGTTGYDVARALREQPGTASTPVVLLASAQAPFDAERARASGIDDHILKPFDTQSLIDKARDVMSRGRGAVKVPSAPAAARPVAAAPVAAAPMRNPTMASAAPVAPTPAVGSAVAAPRPAANRATASFGAPPGGKPPMAVPPSAIVGAAPAPRAVVPVAPVAPIALTAKKPALELADEPAPTNKVSSAAAAATSEMAGKLSGMGLSPEQVQGILALSREVIERVVWEVVPDMAERMIRDEIKRLTS